MADDGHDDHQMVAAAPPPAELPEIKLFGKWSCDDVQISDMSLQVLFGLPHSFCLAGCYPHQ